MYQALYRKYRPKTFDDVVGQNVIIKTLENEVLNNKISHAYLFTGPRGTGKTSIAKILAKIVNCENLNGIIPCNNCISCDQFIMNQNTDIIEIDAASNNGVDEIRNLRDKVNLVPSFGKYKVYIIDEVHMLTTAAFNALLKTLEEPPGHIIFILATTEPHKIPTTIISRCQRFDFKRISVDEIVKRLNVICKNEKIKITNEAVELIANLSDGGMRDSISLLDQLTSYTLDEITVKDVHEVFGTITNEEICEFLNNLFDKNLAVIFNKINEYNSTGKNISKVIELIIYFLKDTLIYINSSQYFEDNSVKQMYDKIGVRIAEKKIYDSIEILLDILRSNKNSNNIKLLFELGILRILKMLDENLNDDIQIISQENINIYDENKKIDLENNVEIKWIDEETRKKINSIKKIRINNTLSLFNKKQMLEFKKNLDLLKELLMDPDYSSMVALILDGELKAKGEDNLIFVYKTKQLEEYFNSSLDKIEDVLFNEYKTKYKPIAVEQEEWETIKTEFNKNLKQNINCYKYIEEEPQKEEESIKKSKKNKIEELFEDIIEYS